jgi:hypothetical protein
MTSPIQQQTPIPKDTCGLSLWYRLRWRAMYGLLAWGGPPQRVVGNCPRERMRKERAARVAAARATHV